MLTTLANQFPVANARFNRLQSPAGNTADALPLGAISGIDLDGAVASFTVTTLPAAAAGVLALNGTPVAAGQSIALADISSLTFDPAATSVGNAFFTFTATDNAGAVSKPALYEIAIGQDNASVYTSTPLKGGANEYQDGDAIANVVDANSSVYNSAAALTDNGVRTASVSSGSLAPGLELDAETGQVRVLDRQMLLAGTYPVGIRTVDANGGITTQTVNLQIGNYPLPVVLTSFTATAAGVDGQLRWTTAQELANSGFGVERSFDGLRFETLTFIAGAATSALSHRYAYDDAGVGRLHLGTVYYRLQQLDQRGKASYSPVQVVTFAPPALTMQVALYPNPAQASTTLDMTQLPAGPYQVTMLDATGRVVQVLSLAGGLAHELAVADLRSGLYQLIIQNTPLRVMQRLLKE
ncbi:T9SS type A sorting domain-containing protein [Hymenobacter sp. BRD67]|uniref:T9SS type A sorting domain-containing protein n=1 Tax=Hymenobacter sp. BRD67 TaxID=2675877 RepID=UPI001564736C|nr:T9SS type A sorting domain-containing protein [Hymenobacter sp. BRD67]QKG51377.1 T9SS type A sorting domain-containing protein [Hymenobacter sp. BRD67]